MIRTSGEALMVATRALLIGYGIAALAGVVVGDHSGYLAGLLTAWTGGAILSLLLAYNSFMSMPEPPFDRQSPRAGGRAGSPTRLVKVWDRDLA